MTVPSSFPAVPRCCRTVPHSPLWKDGRISFDEYCVGMAKVLSRAGLTASDGLEAAQASMSDALAALLSADDEQPSEIPVLKRAPSKADVFNPQIVDEVRETLGPDLLEWLRFNYDGVDPEGTGDLDASQVEKLVKATYAPRGQHLARFMKWFAHAIGNLDDDVISKADYLDCMMKLQNDLNYILSPSPAPGSAELLQSPRTKSSPAARHNLDISALTADFS